MSCVIHSLLIVKQPITLPFIYLNFWKGTPFPIKAIIGSTPPPPGQIILRYFAHQETKITRTDKKYFYS